MEYPILHIGWVHITNLFLMVFILLEVLQKPGPLYFDLCLSVYLSRLFPHMYPSLCPGSLFFSAGSCVCPSQESTTEKKSQGAPEHKTSLLAPHSHHACTTLATRLHHTTLTPLSHHPHTISASSTLASASTTTAC